jgi:hypothetical protein
MQDDGIGGLVKSTVLGAALLTGIALAAQAQSVSPAPAQMAHPFGPKPGGAKLWKQQRYQPPADYGTNPKWHPYSEPGRIGPKPN